MARKRDLQGMGASEKHLSRQCREKCLAILSVPNGPSLHCNHTNVGQLHCGASKAADAIHTSAATYLGSLAVLGIYAQCLAVLGIYAPLSYCAGYLCSIV